MKTKPILPNNFCTAFGRILEQVLIVTLQQQPLAKFIKKETMTQVFFCKFCEVFKNTFLQNTSG